MKERFELRERGRKVGSFGQRSFVRTDIVQREKERRWRGGRSRKFNLAIR